MYRTVIKRSRGNREVYTYEIDVYRKRVDEETGGWELDLCNTFRKTNDAENWILSHSGADDDDVWNEVYGTYENPKFKWIYDEEFGSIWNKAYHWTDGTISYYYYMVANKI